MIWDDFRYFLAAARLGSMSRAARELQVDPSTVSRRLSALEEELGAPLIRRSAGGLTLTQEGELVRARVEDAEVAMQASIHAIRASTTAPRGPVRVATSEGIAIELLAPATEDLVRRFPEITLEIEIGQTLVSVPRGEADVALRMLRRGNAPGQPSLLARKLAEVPFALYAPPQGDHEQLPLIVYSDSAPFQPADGHPQLPATRAHVRPSSMLTQRALVAAGVGVAVLPCFVGERGGLQQLTGPLTSIDLWVVVQPELRGAPAVSAVMSFLVELFQRDDIARLLRGRVADDELPQPPVSGQT
jgi:DNA-binding transcriptional LysR family regulator